MFTYFFTTETNRLHSVVSPPPAPTNAGASSECTQWYTVTAADNMACKNAMKDGALSLEMFLALNPFVNSGCTNMWVGYAYCIAGPTNSSIPSSSPSSTAAVTPTSAAVAGTFAPAVRATSLPSNNVTFHAPLSKRQNQVSNPVPNPTPFSPSLELVINLASELFATQIIGAATTNSELDFLCAHLPIIALAEEGLNTTIITSLICTASQAPIPSPADSRAAVITISTKIWIVQAIGSVVGKKDLQTLCDIINPSAAGVVGLDATLVKTDVCAAAKGSASIITARAPTFSVGMAESNRALLMARSD
ncbi:MAG: hypothetical protein M1830_007371 [Pleopsidium flavum]|nr:MAG: hypothetical protein M1830_007371 [Pleopsidium flavum]